jgi:hypothetical protein
MKSDAFAPPVNFRPMSLGFFTPRVRVFLRDSRSSVVSSSSSRARRRVVDAAADSSGMMMIDGRDGAFERRSRRTR